MSTRSLQRHQEHSAFMNKMWHEMRRPVGFQPSKHPADYDRGLNNGCSGGASADKIAEVHAGIFALGGLTIHATIVFVSMIERSIKYNKYDKAPARLFLNMYHLFLKMSAVCFSVLPIFRMLQISFGTLPETGNYSKRYYKGEIAAYSIGVGLLNLLIVPVVRWGIKEPFSRATFMNNYGRAIKIAAFFFSISPLYKVNEVSISFVAKLLSNYSTRSSRR